MRFPLLGKAVALGAVTLALIAALGKVSDVVSEREGRLHEAQRGVADSLAASQTLLGPVLHRRCTESWETVQGAGKDRKTTTESREFILLAAPAQLAVDASVAIERLHRGIFQVNGYLAKMSISAEWTDLTALRPQARHAAGRLRCDAPVMMVSVSDARGIRSATVRIAPKGAAQSSGDAIELAIQPGTAHDRHPRGFHAVLANLSPDAADGAAPLRATLNLELAGTEALGFAPVGDATRVSLASDWPHPSFSGRFLPSDRDVSAQAFSAHWQLSAVASSAQQDLLRGGAVCSGGEGAAIDSTTASADVNTASRPCIETFGVSFIDPVNPYVLSDRATKYGLLFVVLTFVAVTLIEVMQRLRVHPIQYLLVGCALVVFFLLLVSLTEHLPFALAYLIAGAACTLLLGFYGRYVLSGLRAGAAFGAAIGVLYAALYVLLQMEQTALLLGSMLLFAVLAALMVVTRRIDWYALTAQMRAQAPEPTAAGAEAATTAAASA